MSKNDQKDINENPLPSVASGDPNDKQNFDEAQKLKKKLDALVSELDETYRAFTDLSDELYETTSQLKQSEKRLDRANISDWEYNPQTNEVTAGKNWQSMLGDTKGIMPTPLSYWVSRVHIEDRASFEKALNGLYEGKSTFFSNQQRLQGPDGKWQWFRASGNITKKDNKGLPIKITGVLLDISSSIKAEEELREKKLYLQDEVEKSKKQTEILLHENNERQEAYNWIQSMSDVMEQRVDERTRYLDEMNRNLVEKERHARYLSEIDMIGSSVESIEDLLSVVLERIAIFSGATLGRVIYNRSENKSYDTAGDIWYRHKSLAKKSEPKLPTASIVLAENKLQSQLIKEVDFPKDVSAALAKKDIKVEALITVSLQSEENFTATLELFLPKLNASSKQILITVDRMVQEVTRTIDRLSAADKLSLAQDSLVNILKASPIGVSVVMKGDEKTVFCNERLSEMCGYTIAELSEISLFDLIDVDNKKFLIKTLADTGEVPDQEVKMIRADGEIIRVLLSIMPIIYQNKWAWINWTYDITELKRNQGELLIARVVAEDASQAKSHFLSNMSHEIRTPMNAILGFSDLILLDKGLKPEHRKNMTIVKRSGGHLLSLINNILDMSKIEAGHVEILKDDFNIKSLFEDVSLLFKMNLSEKALDFSIDIEGSVPDAVYGDKRRIRQILINLIGNAIKFTDKGSVNVTCQATQGAENNISLKITISDTGHGIAQKDQDKIFSPFEQTKYGMVQGEGSGLGLPLSRSFAREMGGDIKVTSDLGKGTTLHITLELETAITNVVDMPVAEKEIIGLFPGYKPPKILVVDDMEENREYFMTILESVGFTVKSGVNGVEALSLAQEWKPDLILLDLIMPVMSGQDALGKLRNTPEIMNIPVIIVSASIMNEEVSKLVAAGANDFLAKPILRQDLLKAIGRQVSIEYDYETDASDRQTTSDINIREKLPEKLIAQMLKATSELNIVEMDKLILMVENHDKALAETFSCLQDKYKWQEMERILSS